MSGFRSEGNKMEFVNRFCTLQEPKSFLHPDDVKIIHLLMQNTHLSVKLGKCFSNFFRASRGVPQGVSLFSALFVVYLEAALREFRALVGNNYEEMIYADDLDFVFEKIQTLQHIFNKLPYVFSKWFLSVNSNKTKFTMLTRIDRRSDESWRRQMKLGSHLGDSEDVTRRKILAMDALTKYRLYGITKNKIKYQAQDI
ncbi:uncharacterized protein LOC115231660 [Octopus sinensis]|uniref:Uncharacterized protein LOC115231660 n=1 Tax=Octopus sinensis TaxID=2607531 RepID=A0A6P7U0G7_9MOLL|nr:uncharacterized protein LOC115231660 [Octopus sinensis]